MSYLFLSFAFFLSTVLASNEPSRTQGQSAFINNETYQEVEWQHAGWVDALHLMIEYANGSFGRLRPQILELGPGPGTSTPVIHGGLSLREKNTPYEAVDIDADGIEKLKSRLEELGITDIDPLLGDGIDRVSERRFNTLFSMFSMSHLTESQRSRLFQNVAANMDLRLNDPALSAHRNKGGFFLVTDEFLPPHYDEASRREALWLHHGDVIFDALLKGNEALAMNELEALFSGLERIGDFKVSTTQFENELWRAGLSFKKVKVYPLSTDLTPRSLSENREIQHAQSLWKKESPLLRQSLASARGSSSLPPQARIALHRISNLFREKGLDRLLQNPRNPSTPSDKLRWGHGFETRYGGRESSESHGVYTYLVLKPPVSSRAQAIEQNAKGLMRLMSDLSKGGGLSPIELGAKLSKSFRASFRASSAKQNEMNFVAVIRDAMEELLQRPPLGWTDFKGFDLGRYEVDLQYRQRFDQKIEQNKLGILQFFRMEGWKSSSECSEEFQPRNSRIRP